MTDQFRLSPNGAIAATLIALLGVVALLAVSAPAKADLRICNKSTSQVGVAIGFRASEDWQTEGWWNLPAASCETIIPGPLISRFYYLYAIDYDLGSEFTGSVIMCTDEKKFTIVGIQDCIARGYERNGFREIDTGDHQTWLVEIPALAPSEEGNQ